MMLDVKFPTTAESLSSTALGVSPPANSPVEKVELAARFSVRSWRPGRLCFLIRNVFLHSRPFPLPRLLV